MKREPRLVVHWLSPLLLALAILILIADLHVSTRTAQQIEELASHEPGCTCLPLPSLPLRLIHEDPRCAQKIIEVMNVTNVRILENESQLPQLNDRTRAKLRELGFDPRHNTTRAEG